MLASAACALAALALPAAASADVTSVFGDAVECQVQPSGARFCGGPGTIVPSFDGAPIDVNVTLPPAPASGPDGPYPLVMTFHGWGGSEMGFDNGKAGRGYAVFSMSDRGWGESCGADAANANSVDCRTKGYVHLMDTRYEVRDAQYFASLLADEGLVDPQKIAAIGGSYGGGISLALGALNDRVMLPDGSLTPWESPQGKPMRIAVAAPKNTWSDLASALVPNGATLDYVADAPYLGPDGGGRIGIPKLTLPIGLYALGGQKASYALPGVDQDANLTAWIARMLLGEPFDDEPTATDLVDELSAHHSAYNIDPSEAPAPLLLSNGTTDDLFPVDEVLRFYNRTRTLYPDTPIALNVFDTGHPRGSARAPDDLQVNQQRERWLDYYLKGEGDQPEQGVQLRTTTCPVTAPSGGPFFADSWAELAPGEVRGSSDSPRVVLPAADDPITGVDFAETANRIPQHPSADACTRVDADDPDVQETASSLRLDPVLDGGYTLAGSPTVVMDAVSPGPNSQVAARLLDVAPDGSQMLVARGVYRPELVSPDGPARQVFQLHPTGWRFEPGHVAKLELLPADAPYARPSNGQAPVIITRLELRLPVLEQPGGVVQTPAPKIVPQGYQPARGY